jgi:3-oxoadipate enol-lactonase
MTGILDQREAASIHLALAASSGADLADPCAAAIAAGCTTAEIEAVAALAGATIDVTALGTNPPAAVGAPVWTERHELDLAGQRSAVVRRRGAERNALLLCHSAGLDHRMWAPVVAALPADTDVVAFDMRGHGTGRPLARFEVVACADDAVAVLDALAVSRVHVAGVSLGGAVAQEFALRHPERAVGLTLMATLGRGGEALRQRAAAADTAGLAAQVAETLSRWFSPGALAVNAPYVRYARQQVLDWTVDAWREVWTGLAGVDTLDRLGAVAVPTLCIAGEQDTSTPPPVLQSLRDAIPGGRLVTVPGPHLFVLEDPGRTAALLAEHHERVR